MEARSALRIANIGAKRVLQDKEGQRSSQHIPAVSNTVTSLRSAARELESAREAAVGSKGDEGSAPDRLKFGISWLRILWNFSVVIAVSVYIARFSRYDSSSTLFPKLVGYPVLILALVSLGLEVLQLIQRRPARSAQPHREQISLVNLLIALALGIVYFLLWTPLGFELDSVVLMIVAPIVLGYPKRRIIVLALIGFLTAALFTYLFGLGSGAILPLGYFNIGWP